MKKINLFVLLSIVNIYFCFGQMNSHIRHLQLNEMVNKAAHQYSIYKNGTTTNYQLDEIEGTPYLTDDYKESRIILTNGEMVESVMLKYNIFLDYFEFLRNTTSFILTNNFDIDTIYYNNKTFVYKKIISDNSKLKYGYYESLVKGKCKLFKRYQLTFNEPVPAETQFHQSKPPKFTEIDPYYYLSFEDNETLERIKTNNKQKFSTHFKNTGDIIYTYIKKEKLKITNDNDLKKIINHYNDI